MLQLALLANQSNSGKAEMFIDYQNGSIGFTVIHEEKQFDFGFELDQWESFKSFIELQIEQEKKNESK